jgi:hypothetical protein
MWYAIHHTSWAFNFEGQNECCKIQYLERLEVIHSRKTSSSTVCPLYSGFPSSKTKFRHLSLSLVFSSINPWFVMLRLTPSIHLSLGLPLLRVPSGSHSKIFSSSLFLFMSVCFYLLLLLLLLFNAVFSLALFMETLFGLPFRTQLAHSL